MTMTIKSPEARSREPIPSPSPAPEQLGLESAVAMLGEAVISFHRSEVVART